MLRPVTDRAIRSFLILLVAVVLPGVPGVALAQETPPDVLVKTVTNEIIEIIARDKDIKSGNQKKVVELVEAKVLPHFSFGSMTALAMGQNWGKATPEQKKLLTNEFRTLLVRTYASALSAYGDQKFEFRPLRAKPTDTDVTVNVRVLQPGAQAVAIDYDMEKTASGWKVYNVYVGGVSLVLNYRTDFTNLVREGGIDGLVKTLQSKNSANEQGAAMAPAKK
jgi:phospholipid transport system substrate-binding protein